MTTSFTTNDQTFAKSSVALDLGGSQVLLTGGLDPMQLEDLLQMHLQPYQDERGLGAQLPTLGDLSKELDEGGRLYIPIVIPVANAKDLLITQGRKLAESLVEEIEQKIRNSSELPTKQSMVYPETSLQMDRQNHDPAHPARNLSSVHSESSVQQIEQQIERRKPANLSRKRPMVSSENNVRSFGPAQVRQKTSHYAEWQQEAEAQSDVKLIEIEPDPAINSGGSPVFLAIDDDGDLVNVATAQKALEGVKGIPRVQQSFSARIYEEQDAARRSHGVKREDGKRLAPVLSTDDRYPSSQEWATSRAEYGVPWWKKTYDEVPFVAGSGICRDHQTSMTPSLIKGPQGNQHAERQNNRRATRNPGDLFCTVPDGLVERISRIQAGNTVGRTMVKTENLRLVKQLDCIEKQDFRLTVQDILQTRSGVVASQPRVARANGDRQDPAVLSSTISSRMSLPTDAHEKSLAVPAPLGRPKTAQGDEVIKGRVLEQRFIFPRWINAEQRGPVYMDPTENQTNPVHKGKVIVLPSQ